LRVIGNFQKTFVDQLLRSRNSTGKNFKGGGGGWSDQACDWMLALLDPATRIVVLLHFLPIRRYGYAVLYKVVFCSNILMATGLLSHGHGAPALKRIGQRRRQRPLPRIMNRPITKQGSDS
jgi:hypothetical protein